MHELEQLRVFVTIADEGGFAAAARRLGLSAPAVTRGMGALEERLGARLLHRTTRSVRLTEVGERYLADCRRILADLADADAAARGAHRAPQGELAITAPVMFGRLHVAPVLLDFLAAHPAVTARVAFLDRVVHLLDEGFDVAVRIARLPDSSYTATRVGHVRRHVVASPDYLARHGVPASPDDLPSHAAIGFVRTGGGVRRWRFADGGGNEREDAQPRAPMLVNSVDVALAAALGGHGLASMLSYQVRDHLASGRLVRVLAAFELPPIPVHLVYAAGAKAPAKVRAFIDFAAERLREEPALQDP